VDSVTRIRVGSFSPLKPTIKARSSSQSSAAM
jgi:hypothetical protein